MEQLRVPRLLAGALAAVSGAVVASFFGIEGTLIGAALVSLWWPRPKPCTPLAGVRPPSGAALTSPPGWRAGRRERRAPARRHPSPDPLAAGRGRGGGCLGMAVGAITGVEAVAGPPITGLWEPAGRGRHLRRCRDRRASRRPRDEPAAGTSARRRRGPHQRRGRRLVFPQRPRPRGDCPSTTGPTTATTSTNPPHHPEAVTRGWWRTWTPGDGRIPTRIVLWRAALSDR